MLQRINRANKIRNTGRARTPNRTGTRRRLKNDSAVSKVIIIKEDTSPGNITNMNLANNIKLSPRRTINSFATSIFSESNTIHNESFCNAEVAAFQSAIEAVQPPANKVLKEQIIKCTENKLKRRGRGRRERGKLEDINNITVNIPNKRILEEDCKLNESMLTTTSNNLDISQKGNKYRVRKPIAHNTLKVSSMKVVKKSSKCNPKRYIARKYLTELYDKIISHVKEIERDRKYVATKQGTKRSREINKKDSNIKL
jgi:hypothetical protein